VIRHKILAANLMLCYDANTGFYGCAIFDATEILMIHLRPM